MARTFDNDGDGFEVASAAVTAPPCTFAIYGSAASPTVGTSALIGCYDADSTAHYFVLQGFNNALRFGASGNVASTTWGSGWAWNVGVTSSTTSRYVWFNGTQSAEDTTSVSPTGIDETVIGRQGSTWDSFHADGDYDYPTIWDVALSDAEITELSAGRNPFTMTNFPAMHCKAIGTGGIQDVVGGLSFSEIGTVGEAGTKPLGW